MVQTYVYLLVLLAVALLGIGLWLLLRKPGPPTPPPPPGTQSVFMVGAVRTAPVCGFWSTYYANQIFVSGQPGNDANTLAVLNALQSGVDANAHVSTVAEITAAIAPGVNTLPLSLAGYCADAPLDIHGNEQVLLINNVGPAYGDAYPVPPQSNFGTLNSFLFVTSIVPSDAWVQANLMAAPLNLTISTSSGTSPGIDRSHNCVY